MLGCLGHPALRQATVNLDRMAEEGVLFQNTYASSFVCVPSRASMWSGLYTHHCQGWNNYKGLEPETPTFINHLAAAGYRTAIFGRTDHLSGRHTVRARVSAWTRSACILRPNYRMLPPQHLSEENPRPHLRDWQHVEKSLAWLAENRHRDTPFFLYLGFSAPHPPFVASSYYLKKIDQQAVDIPAADDNQHPALVYQRVCKNWQHGFSQEMVRKVRTTYLAMVSEVDAMVGFFRQQLKELGLADSTVVIFTSDHGELAMEHQQYYKMSPYEGSSRVPLLLCGPGLPRGTLIQQPVSLIDIFPTLLALAEAPVATYLDGHSLLPLTRGKIEAYPDYVLAECHDSSLCTGCFLLRQGDWKYVVYAGLQPQLFHLKEDPGELQNLVEKKPSLAAEMEKKLRALVNYLEVDRQVKDYDRESFARWRQEQLAQGTYYETMSRIFSGWDYLSEEEIQPWTGEDEARIEVWLKGKDGDGCQHSGEKS